MVSLAQLLLRKLVLPVATLTAANAAIVVVASGTVGAELVRKHPISAADQDKFLVLVTMQT